MIGCLGRHRLKGSVQGGEMKRTLLKVDPVTFWHKRPYTNDIHKRFGLWALANLDAFVTNKYKNWLNFCLQVAGTMQKRSDRSGNKDLATWVQQPSQTPCAISNKYRKVGRGPRIQICCGYYMWLVPYVGRHRLPRSKVYIRGPFRAFSHFPSPHPKVCSPQIGLESCEWVVDVSETHIAG